MLEFIGKSFGSPRAGVAAALFAAALSAVAGAAPAQAQDAYPSRVVKVIVPQPPGGGFDFVGRLLADRMGKQLGQTFNTLQEVVAEAKAKPRSLTYASAGNGSGQHVLAAALWHLAGVELVHVPYRGAQAAYQDLLGGRVDLFFDLAPTAGRQIAGGRVKALASSGAQRNPAHPDLPTVRETGVAQLELESWFGLFAPSKTSPEVLQRLRSELAGVVVAPDVTETFVKAGGRPLSLDETATRKLVEGDVSRWTTLIREAGITSE